MNHEHIRRLNEIATWRKEQDEHIREEMRKLGLDDNFLDMLK
jgi:hypothetical protein